MCVRVLHTPLGYWGGATTIEKEADGTIFVGAERAVVRLQPEGDGYREEWLVPALRRLADE